MTSVQDVYTRLLEAVTSTSRDAGVRITTTCQPSGGPGSRLMPPTYPGGYLHEQRVLDDGLYDTVLLDSFQSQANRIEEALLEARDEGRIQLPLFEMRVEVEGWNLRLTSLDMPHRYADAYLRDSLVDGTRFDKTEIGKSLRIAEPTNATALFVHDPGSLVFGAWNSQRSGRQPKFSRAYRSETIGIGYQTATRKGGRHDPLNLTGAVDDSAKREADWKFVVSGKKEVGKRLSEIGHGHVPSREEPPGGVTVTEARRLAFLSFAQLARLRFGDLPRDAQLAGRTALAALALAGDRLAFDRAGLVYRSGCELTVVDDVVAWEQRGGEIEPFELGVDLALELFEHARTRAAEAGLAMRTDTIAIEPVDQLRSAIAHALLRAENEG